MLIVLTLCLSLLLCGVWCYLAPKFGFLDIPDQRKLHLKPTATSAGIPLLITLIALFPVGFTFYESPDKITYLTWITIIAFFTLLGFLDDIFSLPAILRLLIQAILAVSVLIVPTLFQDGPTLSSNLSWTTLSLPGAGLINIAIPLALFLSVIWIMLCVNMLNFIDGVNGLASGSTIIVLTGSALLASSQGKTAIMTLCVLAIAALAGFLPFNLTNRLFLGDAGSYFCGSIIAMVSSVGLLKTATFVTFGPLMLLLLHPIANLIFVIFTRLKNKTKPWQADNNHWHDILRRRGFSDRKITLHLLSVSLFALLFALAIAAPFRSVLLGSISAGALIFSWLYLWRQTSGTGGSSSKEIGGAISSASGSAKSSTNAGSKTG